MQEDADEFVGAPPSADSSVGGSPAPDLARFPRLERSALIRAYLQGADRIVGKRSRADSSVGEPDERERVRGQLVVLWGLRRAAWMISS